MTTRAKNDMYISREMKRIRSKFVDEVSYYPSINFCFMIIPSRMFDSLINNSMQLSFLVICKQNLDGAPSRTQS